MKKILVCGAGGFIGTHLVNRLKSQGHYVIGADIKASDFCTSTADEFHVVDLRNTEPVNELMKSIPNLDELYQLSANMGGAGYIFTGENDANIMHSSAMINLNLAQASVKHKVKKVFYSSSACMYPKEIQTSDAAGILSEDLAYPANPDSEYGWEKLFSERLWMSFARNHGIEIRIARLHNVFGPLSHYSNGREKFPGAVCYKVATANGTIQLWGDGTQARSFLYIDECIEGIQRLMASNYTHPINLGSDRSITVDELAQIVIKQSGKNIKIEHTPGPTGVATRNSDNTLIRSVLGWAPQNNLEFGLQQTYNWIVDNIDTQ